MQAENAGAGGINKEEIITFAVWGLVAALLAVILFNFLQPDPANQMVGRPGPNFGLKEVHGGEVLKLSDYQGKVVLMDFWATWCPPCRKQMPALQQLAADPELAEHVHILSINTDDEDGMREELVRTFLQRNALTMTTLLDDGSASSLYRVSRIPTLVVLRPDGVVDQVSVGVHDVASLRKMVSAAQK